MKFLYKIPWRRNLFRKKKSGLGKSLPIGLASPVKPEVAWEFLPSSDASLWVWRQVLVSARIPENWYLYSQSSFSSFDPITPLPWWSLIMEEKNLSFSFQIQPEVWGSVGSFTSSVSARHPRDANSRFLSPDFSVHLLAKDKTIQRYPLGPP